MYAQLAKGYTTVVEYEYDPLYGLIGAHYSDGSDYEYQKDPRTEKLVKKSLRRQITTLVLVCLAAMTGACNRNNANWQIQTVAKAARYGAATSIAVGSDGRARIAFCSGGLEYASYDGTEWQVDSVWSGSDCFSPVLFLDSSGSPHILFSAENELKYAHWNSNVWQTETIAFCRTRCRGSSLVVNNQGIPHLSYVNEYRVSGQNFDAEDRIEYAKFDKQQWITESVDVGTTSPNVLSVAGNTSLALDADSRPHIAYYMGVWPDGGLRYASRDLQGWSVTTIEPSTDLTSNSAYVSLVLDRYDRPHLAFQSFSERTYNQELKYITYDGREWQARVVDSGIVSADGGVSSFSSLALDSAGHPHIGYYYEPTASTLGVIFGTSPPSELKYACFDGEAWSIEIVDKKGDTGYWISLTLDAQEQVHISYYSQTNEQIKYALAAAACSQTPAPLRHSTEPTITAVTPLSPQEYPSLAVSSATPTSSPAPTLPYAGQIQIEGEVQLTEEGWATSAVWSPDSGRIAYIRSVQMSTASEELERELWVMNADGSDQVQVAEGIHPLLTPSWSPDGTRLLYVTVKDTGSKEAVIVDWGRGTSEVVATVDEQGAGWLSDERIAFVRNGQLVLKDLGKGKEEVKSELEFTGSALDTAFIVSPDRTRLAYIDKQGALWSVDISTMAKVRVNSIGNAVSLYRAHSVSWSPDSRSLAYITGLSRSRLWVADVIKDARLLYEDAAQFYCPTWSADSRVIAFERDHNGTNSSAYNEIYLINRDGSGLRNLTENRQMENSPVWSPDGSKIIFLRPPGYTPQEKERYLWLLLLKYD